MALKPRKIAAIQVEYCAGIVTIEKVAKKHGVAKKTVIRLAKKYKWKRSKRPQNVPSKVTKKILKKAETKFIEKESDRLARFTEGHVVDIRSVRLLTRLNLSDTIKAAKEAQKKKSSLHKEVSENFFALQKVCKIASETLTNCYREERLAMGLSEKDNAESITINNIQDLSKLSTDELYRLREQARNAQ